MRVYLYEEDQTVDDVEVDSINIFGGEDDSLDIDKYGIQIGDLTIAELTPSQMKDLGIKILNHLSDNGHDFEFWNKYIIRK